MAYQYIDRNVRLPAASSDVADRYTAQDNWEMTDAERLALAGLLSDLRPECAVEVGVYRAGSLSVLSRFCKKVYALDIDPACAAHFQDRFTNVEFVTGNSSETLPQVLTRIESAQEKLGFVLIDADHSRDGVLRDINNVLRHTPTQPLYILMHDSFNPECRRGMKEANWVSHPNVHIVDLDFVTGRFVTAEEPDSQRQMWCGFALAVLLPEPRNGKLVIHENESLMFRTAMRHSVYRMQKWWNPAFLLRELRYRLVNFLKARAPNLLTMLRRLLRSSSHGSS